MNKNLRTSHFVCISLVAFFALALTGCERTPFKRHYREIVLESDQPVNPPVDFMKGQMPQDDIHKGLTMPGAGGIPQGEMPQDDIHKGLVMPQGSIPKGKMPQDDIHKGLVMPDGAQKGMPQDDIHKGIMPNSGMPAGMGMDMNNMQNAALNDQLNASVDRTPLAWKAPSGWTEIKGSGMRMATFKNADQDNPVEVTIVSLGGQAGGLEPNVTRWMRQINIDVPGAEQLDAFIKGQEKIKTDSGLPAMFVDLTQLQKDAQPNAPSLVAVVIERDNAQIFVKMTGSKQAVLANLKTFRSLVSSIKVNE